MEWNGRQTPFRSSALRSADRTERARTSRTLGSGFQRADHPDSNIGVQKRRRPRRCDAVVFERVRRYDAAPGVLKLSPVGALSTSHAPSADGQLAAGLGRDHNAGSHPSAPMRCGSAERALRRNTSDGWAFRVLGPSRNR